MYSQDRSLCFRDEIVLVLNRNYHFHFFLVICFILSLTFLVCLFSSYGRKEASWSPCCWRTPVCCGWVGSTFLCETAFLFSLGVNCKFWITMLKTIKYLREILWFFLIFHCSVVCFTHQGLHWCHRKDLVFSCNRKCMRQPKARVGTAWYHSYHSRACCLFLLYSFFVCNIA